MTAKVNGEREPASLEEAQRLHEQLEQLNAAANAGHPGALEKLEAFLRDHEEILEVAGDLARHAEKAWIERVVGKDSFTRIAVTSQVERLKEELAGPDPSPLERLLVEHVVITHLAEQQAAISAAQAGGSIPQAMYQLKRAESAQKRLLAATKLLATFRAMQPRSSRPHARLKLFDPDGRKTA